MTMETQSQEHHLVNSTPLSPRKIIPHPSLHPSAFFEKPQATTYQTSSGFSKTPFHSQHYQPRDERDELLFQRADDVSIVTNHPTSTIIENEENLPPHPQYRHHFPSSATTASSKIPFTKLSSSMPVPRIRDRDVSEPFTFKMVTRHQKQNKPGKTSSTTAFSSSVPNSSTTAANSVLIDSSTGLSSPSHPPVRVIKAPIQTQRKGIVNTSTASSTTRPTITASKSVSLPKTVIEKNSVKLLPLNTKKDEKCILDPFLRESLGLPLGSNHPLRDYSGHSSSSRIPNRTVLNSSKSPPSVDSFLPVEVDTSAHPSLIPALSSKIIDAEIQHLSQSSFEPVKAISKLMLQNGPAVRKVHQKITMASSIPRKSTVFQNLTPITTATGLPVCQSSEIQVELRKPTSGATSATLSIASSLPGIIRAKKSTSKIWLHQLDDHKPPLEQFTPIISEADTISLPYPRLVGSPPFALRGPRAMLVPAFTVSSNLVNFEDSLHQVAGGRVPPKSSQTLQPIIMSEDVQKTKSTSRSGSSISLEKNNPNASGIALPTRDNSYQGSIPFEPRRVPATTRQRINGEQQLQPSLSVIPGVLKSCSVSSGIGNGNILDRPAVWTKATSIQMALMKSNSTDYVNKSYSSSINDNASYNTSNSYAQSYTSSNFSYGRDLRRATLVNGLRREGTKKSNLQANIDIEQVALEVMYKEYMQRKGHTLRGPVITLLFGHYTAFLFVLLAAYLTSLAAYIRFFVVVSFYFLSLMHVEWSRLIYARHPNAVLPLYLATPILIILLIVSREAHKIVMVLWFPSMNIILLQTGSQRLPFHLLFHLLLFVGAYYFSLFLITVAYRPNCANFFCGVESTSPINYAEESVLVINCVFITIPLLWVERFINKSAKTLLDREDRMDELYTANVNLQRQLRVAKNTMKLDLEAPIARVNEILVDLKGGQQVEMALVNMDEEIDQILDMLTTDQLYKPEVAPDKSNPDVNNWLSDMRMTASPSSKKLLAGLVERKNTDAETDEVENTTPLTIGLIPSGAKMSKVQILGTMLMSFKDVDSKEKRLAFEMLEKVDDPSFDVFELEGVTAGRSLYFTGWFLFQKHQFSQKFHINEFKFRHWLAKIESGYIKTNPYHNATHAADVTHAMNYFITRDRLDKTLTDEEKLACLIAPIIHDYRHPGFNNAFMINAKDPIAMRYNDQAVLEQFHLSSVFELMTQNEYNILDVFTVEQKRSIRENVISMVMATDMAQHFEWIGKFKAKMTGGGINFANKQDRKIVLNMAIKCADVNNPTKPLNSCVKWTELIMAEFFLQGDEEKRRGLPVSVFMNRDTTDIPKSQIGFIDFIVLPLFETWKLYMNEDVGMHMSNIQSNKAHWKWTSEQNGSSTMVPSSSTAHQAFPAVVLSTNASLSNSPGRPISSAVPPEISDSLSSIS